MPSSDDRSEPERANDVVDTDEAARGDELSVMEEVEFCGDMLPLMVIVEEDEVELWAIVGGEVFYCVDIEEGDSGSQFSIELCVDICPTSLINL